MPKQKEDTAPFESDSGDLTLVDLSRGFARLYDSKQASLGKLVLSKTADIINKASAGDSPLGLILDGAHVLYQIACHVQKANPNLAGKDKPVGLLEYDRLRSEGAICILGEGLGESIKQGLDPTLSLVEGGDDDDSPPSTLKLIKYYYQCDSGYSGSLENEHYIFWLEEDGSLSSDMWLPQQWGEDADTLTVMMREVLLKDLEGPVIELFLGLITEEPSLRTLPNSKYPYHGGQGDLLVERWRAFQKEGIPRSVILHGPPGTGKSTLAQHAARELGSGRTVYIATQTLQGDIYEILNLLDILDPDVLIIDDLDRLPRPRLSLLLDFFDYGTRHVGLVIATTNHLSNIPKALQRPGRFDEIWEVTAFTTETFSSLALAMAAEEDVVLLPETLDAIVEKATTLRIPGAYLRELILRIKALGPQEGLVLADTDLTFLERRTKAGLEDAPDPRLLS